MTTNKINRVDFTDNNKTYHSICVKIKDIECINDFVFERSSRGGELNDDDVWFIFNSVVLPMGRLYVKDPVGKDYIGFNYENGYFFLSEEEVISKKLVK